MFLNHELFIVGCCFIIIFKEKNMEFIIIALVLFNVFLIIAYFRLLWKIRDCKSQYKEIAESNKKLHRLIAIKYLEFSLRFNPELKEKI